MEAKHTAMPFDADAVRALVAAKYPGAMTSPLAQIFAATAAADEADRACEFAAMQAKADIATKNAAFEYALSCITSCEAQATDYDEETLSHNIESNYPELSLDDCNEIARAALPKTGAA